MELVELELTPEETEQLTEALGELTRDRLGGPPLIQADSDVGRKLRQIVAALHGTRPRSEVVLTDDEVLTLGRAVIAQGCHFEMDSAGRRGVVRIAAELIAEHAGLYERDRGKELAKSVPIFEQVYPYAAECFSPDRDGYWLNHSGLVLQVDRLVMDVLPERRGLR